MRKKRLTLFSAALAAAALAYMHLSAAGAPPGLPATFSGTVKMNGKNVPTDGSVMITAWTGGVQNGNAVKPELDLGSGDTIYRIDVGGGTLEDVVIFKVGTSPAGQGTWNNTIGLIALALTAYTVYVPFSSK